MKLLVLAGHRLNRLRIGTRLALSFATLLGLTVALGVAALWSMAQVDRSTRDLAEHRLPSVRYLGVARAEVLAFRDLQVKDANASDDSYRDEYEDKMKEVAARVATALGDYDRLAGSAQERALADAVAGHWKELQAVTQKVVALSRAGKADDARDIGDGAGKMSLDDTVLAIDKLTQFSFDSGQAAAAQASAVYRRARTWTLGLLGATLVLGAALAALVSRGLLAQLGGEPGTAAAVARAVAEGDLSTPIRLGAGDNDSLMARLQHMQASLTQVVATVRQGSEHVASASQEIAQGNSDLSGRTEQQASALQQTTASMEQLGSTVRQNADSARQADRMAQNASTVAQRGGEVVARVVSHMRGIHESSQRIGDIIGTIDGIAFQTNILALNAAVEAARAGEQGRGFAVVASEVRSLAQRSAEAAREIKALIATSVERVAQGTTLVDQAGATMTEVVAAIGRVSAIVGEISAASADQSASVTQVGQAVSQMDQTTQQNAALVEQSAAAAESLREQARQLVEVVAAFRLAPAPA